MALVLAGMHACAIKFAFSSALMIFFHPSPSQGLFERLHSSQKSLTDTPTPLFTQKRRLENTKVDFRRLRKKGGERLDQGLARIMGSGKRQLPKKHECMVRDSFFARKCIVKYFIIIFCILHFVSPTFLRTYHGIASAISVFFLASASDKRFPAFLLRKCIFYSKLPKG